MAEKQKHVTKFQRKERMEDCTVWSAAVIKASTMMYHIIAAPNFLRA